MARQLEASLRVLVLGAGPAQLGLLEAAKTHGIRTAVCDRDPSAPGFALAGRRCIVSTEDEPAIERLASALELGGVIAPGSDWAVASAARVAAKLNLPHPVTPDVALRATNKQRQREALAAAGVPQPRWQLVVEPEGSLELEPPFLVKAPDRQGRRGLSVVRSHSGFPEAFARARAASRGNVVLVEELLDGPEVTVTGFSVDGRYLPLAVADALGGDEIELPRGYVWSSEFAAAAAEVTERAVEAIGIENGPSHAVLRISRGGPEVISVTPRLGGGHDAELVQAATSVDLNWFALQAALGVPVAASEILGAYEEQVGGVVTRFIPAPDLTTEAVETPQGLPGVVGIQLYGSSVAGRAGAVLAVGGSREDALARAAAAAERIRFVPADVEAALI